MKTILNLVLALTATTAFADADRRDCVSKATLTEKLTTISPVCFNGSLVNTDSRYDGVCLAHGKKFGYVAKSDVKGKKIEDTVTIDRYGRLGKFEAARKRRVLTEISCYNYEQPKLKRAKSKK